MNPSNGRGSPSADSGLPPGEMFPPGHRLGRYEVLQHVGAGGMGVVYQARDTERGHIVALKTLHRMEPGALLRLKNEFRYIANVSHHNLVSLHELHSEQGQWFFTMEYIEGENLWSVFQRAARALEPTREPRGLSSSDTVTVTPPGSQAFSTLDDTVTSDRLGTRPAPVPAAPVMRGTGPQLPLPELRRVFRELALGIHALHAARKLHCDIKPRNVMLARDGRVVLLDFGLSSDRAEPSAGELAGTPAYISPEQVMGQPASEASDWYAFGVMLYEALLGQRAFPNSRSLLDKASLDSPAFPPSPQVPEDLRELCVALLVREPPQRLTGRVVLERLGVTEVALARGPRTGALIGRESHLAALHESWRSMNEGRTVVVHVHGASGMGKSSLVSRFFEDLGAGGGAVVLSGRCYERESVPYKAFDTVVDSLTRHLRALPPAEVEALLPPDAAELVRIFPVLRQVETLAPLAPERLESVREQHELRRRAFRAFHALLSGLSRRTPLVLSIDDLQWADEDSIVALGELLEPPEAPRLLLVCGYRTGEGAAAGLLADHQHRASVVGDALRVREVEVGPLSESQSRELAAHLLGAQAPGAQVERLAREAHGSPFFVEELVRYTQAQGEQRLAHEGVSLEQLVRARVKLLPESARSLLEVVAVAGQPVTQGVASRAAALQGDPHTPWTALRSAHLIRTRGSREDDVVECYHDRIRETVSGGLDAGVLQGRHLTLAHLLEASGKADPERLARHFQGGGARDKAGHYATQAAERAASALAFGRAAELYALALECLPSHPGLKEKRADALVNAGRGAEAAALYRDVARSVSPGTSLDLRQRAAEQYLSAGHMTEGLEVLRPLLEEVGLPYPKTPRHALLGIIARSVRMQLGGLRFQERAAEHIPARELLRLNVAWTASKSLGSTDVLRGGYFAVRTMELALAAGETRHVARGLLGMGLTTMARGSSQDVSRGEQWLARGEQMCEQLGDPYMRGLARTLRGSAEMALGRWRAAHGHLLEGARLLEDQCNGVAWEYSQAHACDVHSLILLGELPEATLRGERWLRVSEQNGDRFGAVWLLLNLAMPLLATEGATAAAAQVRRALMDWRSETFSPQEVMGMMALVRCELYRGEPGTAWRLLEERWPQMERDQALSWQFNRVLATQLRAGTAVAVARGRASERKALLARVRRDIQGLDKEGRHYAWAAAELLKAAVATTEGRQAEALRALDASISLYTQAEMAVHVACARRRKGELLGGREGQALIAAADELMRARGIREPARWADAWAPGFTES